MIFYHFYVSALVFFDSVQDDSRFFSLNFSGVCHIGSATFFSMSAGERRYSITSKATEHRATTKDRRPEEVKSGCISANDSNSETEVIRGTYKRRNARNSKEEHSARRPDDAQRETKRGEGKDDAGCGDSKRRGQKTGVVAG